MTMTTASVIARAHDEQVDEPDPAARPRRRSFTAEYKARILDAYDALPGGSDIVELIDATKTKSGLRVLAEWDQGSYPIGVKVTDDELAAIPLRRHDWHGDWNYTITPPTER